MLPSSANLKEPATFKFAFEGRKLNKLWNEVEEGVHVEAGTAHVVCKHCRWIGQHPNHDVHMSTGGLVRHFKACAPYIAKQKALMADPMEVFFNYNAKPVMTTDRLIKMTLDMIVIGNLSFRFAENPAFVKLLNEAYPRCRHPSRSGVSDRLHKEAELATIGKRERFAAIDSKFSMATDAWHSKVGNMEFLGIFPAICGDQR